MRWRDRALVAFDTETTGLNPLTGDRVIEFAAVELRCDSAGRVVEVHPHNFLVNPGIPIPRTVQKLTGITDDQVADKPPFEAIADRVFELLSDAVSVAHNYPFDLAFITEEFRRLGRLPPAPLAAIDTVDLSMLVYPDARGHKLSDLCGRLNVSLDNAHRASDDAEACGRCFTEMARQNDIVDDLQALLEWSDGIGPPPKGPLLWTDTGQVVFDEGPYEGEPVEEHPVHLAWMSKARVLGPQGWQWRYPESTRQWAERWLRVRGSGRARSAPKSFRPEDWVLDPCITPPPAT